MIAVSPGFSMLAGPTGMKGVSLSVCSLIVLLLPRGRASRRDWPRLAFAVLLPA